MKNLHETHVSLQTLAVILALLGSITSVVQSVMILPYRVAQLEGMVTVAAVQSKSDHDLLIKIEAQQTEMKRLLLELAEAHKLKGNP